MSHVIRGLVCHWSCGFQQNEANIEVGCHLTRLVLTQYTPRSLQMSQHEFHVVTETTFETRGPAVKVLHRGAPLLHGALRLALSRPSSCVKLSRAKVQQHLFPSGRDP